MNFERMSPVSRELHRLVYIEEVLSVNQLAEMLTTTPKSVYRLFEGERQLKEHEVRQLSRFFSGLGHNGIAKLHLADGYDIIRRGEVLTNGSPLDEIKELIHEMDEYGEHWDSGQVEQAVEDADQIIEIAQRLKAEIKQKR